jgi:hypothetical protein
VRPVDQMPQTKIRAEIGKPDKSGLIYPIGPKSEVNRTEKVACNWRADCPRNSFTCIDKEMGLTHHSSYEGSNARADGNYSEFGARGAEQRGSTPTTCSNRCPAQRV